MPRYLDDEAMNAKQAMPVQPTNLREEFAQIAKILRETQKLLSGVRESLLGYQPVAIDLPSPGGDRPPRPSPTPLAEQASEIAKLSEEIRQDLRSLSNRL